MSAALEFDRQALTRRILAGMALGFLLGLLLFLILQRSDPEGALHQGIAVGLVDGVLYAIGQIFLAGLQMLVVPLVFVSLLCGTAALDDIRRLGRVGLKTVLLYLATTAIAVTAALTFALVVRPGVGFDLEAADVEFGAVAAPSLVEVVIGIFPRNPIDAMAEGNMLQVIVFAILLGIAISFSGEGGKRLLQFFQDLNEAIMKLVTLVMLVAPLGVFALIARTFSTQGYEAFGPLARYFLLVLVVLLLHGALVYPILLRTLARLNPIRFMRKMRDVQVFAFSTSSSNATIPVTLATVERKLGVHKSVGSFTVPLGATINMDGTAIMQGVATVFIAQAYGIEIGLTGYLMVILTATLASIGTAGVPGVGLIMLAMVLKQVGLPVEGIALIIGVDRLLDMVRTAVNVTGDATVSCIVARSEDRLDLDTFEGDS